MLHAYALQMPPTLTTHELSLRGFSIQKHTLSTQPYEGRIRQEARTTLPHSNILRELFHCTARCRQKQLNHTLSRRGGLHPSRLKSKETRKQRKPNTTLPNTNKTLSAYTQTDLGSMDTWELGHSARIYHKQYYNTSVPTKSTTRTLQKPPRSN